MTRGTTNPNRLRRVDRWLLARHGRLLRSAPDPLVVDLGYGRHPATVLELADRLRRVRPDLRVVGVEIDPERVAAARALSGAAGFPEAGEVGFDLGGFDLTCLAGRQATVIRAFNVLRQYGVDEVEPAWSLMRARLAPGGVVLDGTCDEIGQLASWVVLDSAGPVSLVVALRLAGLQQPGAVAARLPKALIEQNTAPYPVHRFLAELDLAWERARGIGEWGARQRFEAACRAMATAGWPMAGPRLWREGVVEVAWAAVSG